MKGEILTPGFQPTHNSQPWTNMIVSSLLVTYTDSSRKKNTMPHGVTWGCILEQSEQPEAVGDRLCSNKSMRWLRFPGEQCNWLVWIICWVTRDKQLLCPLPVIRKVVWLGDPILGSRLGRTQGPPSFHQMSMNMLYSPWV